VGTRGTPWEGMQVIKTGVFYALGLIFDDVVNKRKSVA